MNILAPISNFVQCKYLREAIRFLIIAHKRICWKWCVVSCSVPILYVGVNGSSISALEGTNEEVKPPSLNSVYFSAYKQTIFLMLSLHKRREVQMVGMCDHRPNTILTNDF